MARHWTEARTSADDSLAALDYIDTYQRNHANRAPMQRSMRLALNLNTPAAVQAMLTQLVRAQLLTIAARHGRTADLLVTELGRERLQRWRAVHAESAAETGEHS